MFEEKESVKYVGHAWIRVKPTLHVKFEPRSLANTLKINISNKKCLSQFSNNDIWIYVLYIFLYDSYFLKIGRSNNQN